MLELTRINGKKVIINCELIEYIDASPDTVISLTTGNKFVVKESIEETVNKVIEYKQSVFQKFLLQIENNLTKEKERGG